MNMQPLSYKLEAAAQVIGVSPKTLSRWRDGGLIRPAVIGKTKLYLHEDLQRLLKSGVAGSAGDNGEIFNAGTPEKVLP